MADQRSAFRFRVPRLRPSVPPPRSTATTSQTRARRPPIQPKPQPPPSPSPPPPPPPPLLQVRPPTPLDPPPVTPSPAPAPAPPTVLEPPVEPSPVLEKQDEPAPPSPASLKTESPPPSPSPSLPPVSPSRMSTQTPVSDKPTSPSIGSQPTSRPDFPPVSPSQSASMPVKEIPSSPSSPVVTETKTIPEEALPEQDTTLSNSSKSQTEPETSPEVKRATETNQAADLNYNEEKHADISTKSNVPDTPQTKPMISDTVRVSESPQSPKPITGPQAPRHEETKAQKPASVITFSGDNRGASMQIGSGVNKQERAIHIYRRYKANPDEIADTTTDGEEISNVKKPENDSNKTKNHGENAYINCNIQGINNSMVFNCSITESNPGVHLNSSFNPNNVKKNTNSMDPKKVKVELTPSQKLTYEPTIRRRCLGGLFMESSDSDADDPEKPRRHGCRYNRGEKNNKDDKIDDC